MKRPGFTPRRRALVVLVIITSFLFTLSFLRDDRSSAQKRDDQAIEKDDVQPEAVLAGTITGRVFQDFNGNGTMDTALTVTNNGSGTIASPIDLGVAGIEVRAYDAAGANVTSGSVVTTNATGDYSITTTGVATGPYRVEFTNLPTGYQPSARSTDSVNGGTATNSGSTVQFITTTPATGVNLAINYPTDYSQSNPEIVASMYAAGDQLAAPNNALPVIVSFPYAAGSVNGGTEAQFGLPAANPLSLQADEVGTTFGLAYARRTRLVYAASFFKRHAGFGPGGPNRIYVLDRTTGGFVTNAFTVPGTVTNAHDTTAPITWNRDNDNTGWDGVGKTSLGGIALSDDEQTLYVMNLANRTLYALNPSTGAQIAAQAAPTNLPLVPSGTCNANDARPFAVTFYHGALYVGLICSAESTLAAGTVDTFTDNAPANGRYDGGEYYIETNGTAGRQAGESFLDFNGNGTFDAGEAFVDNDGNGFYNQGDARQLRAYVYSVNPTTLAFGASPIFQMSLNYRRGVNTHTNGAFGIWRPWSSTYRDAGTATTSRPIYSQPMLTDIAFDNGNLIIALRDRIGDQIGNGTLSNPGDPSATNFYQPRTAGDAIRACGAIGAWTVESNGRCGSPATGTAPQNTSEGPGGGEFYYGDSYDLSDVYVSPAATINGKGGNHDDTLNGGVEQLPGAPDVVLSNFDPIMDIANMTHDGGIRWLNNTTGNVTKGYRMYDGAGNDTGILGKAGGIGGSLVMLLDPAPIEIGNRVWRDANNNGVQDPGENGIANITVRLYQGSTLRGTAVTDANGEYYFVGSTVADPNTNDNIGQVNGGILYSTAYQIRLDNPTNFASGQPLNGLFLTYADVTAQAGDDDANDSDATSVNNPSGSPSAGYFPVVSLTTGGPGANSHRFDIGFAAPTSAAAVTVSGRITTQEGNGIRGVRVTLTEEDGTVHQALTGGFGYYQFDDVLAGQGVVVRVSAKRFRFSEPVRFINLFDNLFELDFVAEE